MFRILIAENNDTQTNDDRRSEERVRVAADIEWASVGVFNSGHLNDLSSSGCFVLTHGEFAVGEVVSIFLPTTDGSRIEIVAEIRNFVEDIGFAARFVSLSETQREFIRNFAELHQVPDTDA